MLVLLLYKLLEEHAFTVPEDDCVVDDNKLTALLEVILGKQ